MSSIIALQRREIISPKADSWLVGGASIVVLSVLAALSFWGSNELILQKFLILTVLVNGTHFLASYRLLYSSRKFALSYPWASIYMPALLISYSAVALGLNIYDANCNLPVLILTGVAAVYLAVHYTGQTWGMMASFAYLDGVRFKPEEKKVLRLCLRVMAIWHMLWALQQLWKPTEDIQSYLGTASVVMNWLGALSACVGARCLAHVGRVDGNRVTMRVVLPFVAIYVWYVFLFFFPAAIFWVQISHALQYLPFPIRVELNRAHEATHPHNAPREVMVYIIVLGTLSALFFGGIPTLADRMGPGAQSVWVIIASIINIHHYFIDGCIWHLNNPVVKQELFSHTEPMKPRG
jgi:hypothetical protein